MKTRLNDVVSDNQDIHENNLQDAFGTVSDYLSQGVRKEIDAQVDVEIFQNTTIDPDDDQNRTTLQNGCQNGSTHQNGYLNGTTHQNGYLNGTIHQNGHQNGTIHQTSYQNGTTNQNGHKNGTKHQNGFHNGTTHQNGYRNETIDLNGYQNGTTHQNGYQNGTTHQNGYQNEIINQNGYQKGTVNQSEDDLIDFNCNDLGLEDLNHPKKSPNMAMRNFKPYGCVACKTFYVSMFTLQRHMTEFHSKSSTDTSISDLPFQCNFCGHNFSKTSALVIHMKCHKDEIKNKKIIYM